MCVLTVYLQSFLFACMIQMDMVLFGRLSMIRKKIAIQGDLICLSVT